MIITTRKMTPSEQQFHNRILRVVATPNPEGQGKADITVYLNVRGDDEGSASLSCASHEGVVMSDDGMPINLFQGEINWLDDIQPEIEQEIKSKGYVY